MTFRCAALNGGFFVLPCAVRDEKFPFDLIAVDLGKKAQICAITSDTQSIHHSCHCSFCGDETRRYTRRIQRPRFAAEHVENLTSGTPVKLTANNLYRSTKAESNRLNLVGIPQKKRYIGRRDCGRKALIAQTSPRGQSTARFTSRPINLAVESRESVQPAASSAIVAVCLDSEDELKNQSPTQNVEKNVTEDLNDDDDFSTQR
ncbi:hypothetical protein ALC56_06349 [Trachymyrmex septentrionalis]|uniref:Uncharacterized protein n=1 Tax=Trachymyrmex septentrionalis TaxID=34720 RepID=A0A195FGC3_9HYME|nr:hypothetical protein ALC56_06349 [Trachymyrmex septentrionalis]